MTIGPGAGSLIDTYGFNPTTGVTTSNLTIYAVGATAGAGFDVQVASASGQLYNYDSERGTVAEGAPNGTLG